MSKFTQKAIRETFLSMLEEKSIDNILIKDIILETGINRNTFYYYYKDIYSLIDDIFAQELIEFNSQAKDNATFYEEYLRAAKLFLTKRHSILNIYQSKSRELVKRYLNEVVNNFVSRFVRLEAEGFHLSENQIEYIIKFYSYSIMGNTLNWIEDGLPKYRDSIILMISRSFENTIKIMISDVSLAGKEGVFSNIEYRHR